MPATHGIWTYPLARLAPSRLRLLRETPPHRPLRMYSLRYVLRHGMRHALYCRFSAGSGAPLPTPSSTFSGRRTTAPSPPRVGA